MSLPSINENPDFTKFKYYELNPNKAEAPLGEFIAKAIAIGLVALVAIIANSIIIYVVIRTKQLHTPINIFILNLAVADLLNASYTSWTFFITDVYTEYILGSVFCKMDGMVEITCMVTSVFSLVAISCDRFVGIIFPFAPRMNKKIAFLVIAIIWMTAIGISVPQGEYRTYVERQWADHVEKFCKEESEEMKTYWVWVLGVVVWVPLSVMVIAYISIILKIDRYDRAMQRSLTAIQLRHRKKVIVMLFAIIVAFFVCWLPFQILVLHRNFTRAECRTKVNDWFKVTFFIAHYLALSNCAINPFIYGASNENFRRAIGIHLPCLIPKSLRVRPFMNQFIFSTKQKPIDDAKIHSEAPTLDSVLDEPTEDMNANELQGEEPKIPEVITHCEPPCPDDVPISHDSPDPSYTRF